MCDADGVDRRALAAELDKPVASQLLRGSPLTRLAYVALDGTPRVVPIAYLWKNRQLIVWTIPTSAKVAAIRQNPAVALTIDYDGHPTRALLLRGQASIDIVTGVPQDYIDASMKTQSARGAEDFESGVRAMYESMARITIELTWARMNDFEATLPREVEKLIAQKK